MPGKPRGINFSRYSKEKSRMIGSPCQRLGPVCRRSALEEAVYVLHVFEKRSQKTPKVDIQLAKGRYADLLKWRKEQQL